MYTKHTLVYALSALDVWEEQKPALEAVFANSTLPRARADRGPRDGRNARVRASWLLRYCRFQKLHAGFLSLCSGDLVRTRRDPLEPS